MSVPVSKNEVCNLSLSRLKVPFITDIDPPNQTEVERLCALHYDLARRKVLRRHTWNFAKEVAALSLATETISSVYSNQYALPSDYMRLRFIDEENLGLVGIDFQIVGRYIHIDNGDSATLDIGYVKDVTNIALWDPLALECLALTLAEDISYGIVGKNVLKKEVKEDLRLANLEAKSINGQDNPPKRITRSSVIAGRRRYGSGGTGGLRQQDDMLI